MSKVVPTVIWKKDVKAVVHRILWWMLDAGVPGNILRHGWQVAAAKQLGIHRITLHRQIEVMVQAGLLIEGKMKGEVMLNTKIFDQQADRSQIRMEKITRGRLK